MFGDPQKFMFEGTFSHSYKENFNERIVRLDVLDWFRKKSKKKK